MAGKGGYQAPKHPAAVSGPGAMSQRTDGGPADRQAMRDIPDAKYGEQQNMQAIQGGAPMAGNPLPQIVPLGAPSARPDEPVTAGNPLGPGVGPAGAGLDQRTMTQKDADDLKYFLPLLEFAAQLPDSSESTRALLRQLKGA